MSDQPLVPQVVSAESPVPLAGSKQLLPVLPPTDELNRMAAYAKFIAPAKFIPSSYRNDVATVFFVIARGREMGLQWTHALESFFDTGNGLGMEQQALLAVLLSRGFRVLWTPQAEIREKQVAECQICRPECKCPMDENGQWVICRCGFSRRSSFTLEEAKSIVTGYARKPDGTPDYSRPRYLAGKDNWKNYWPDMLMWRSFARSGHFIASDVTAGMHIRDEVEHLMQEQKPREQRIAAFQENVDESKVPPELQSALMDAAGPANQGWARERLAQISRGMTDLGEIRLAIRQAIQEAAQIRATQAERKRTAAAEATQTPPTDEMVKASDPPAQAVTAPPAPAEPPDTFPDLFK